MPNKLENLYKNLSADGYELGSLDDFKAAMKDSAKAANLHKNLTEDGYELGSREDFFGVVSAGGGVAAQKQRTGQVGAAQTRGEAVDLDQKIADDFTAQVRADERALRKALSNTEKGEQRQVATSKVQKQQRGYKPTWQEQMAFGMTGNQVQSSAQNAVRSIDKRISDVGNYNEKVNSQIPSVGVRRGIVEDEDSYIDKEGTRHSLLQDANTRQREINASHVTSQKEQLNLYYAERQRILKEMDSTPQDWVDQDGRVHTASKADKQRYAKLLSQLKAKQEQIKKIYNSPVLVAERERDPGFLGVTKNKLAVGFIKAGLGLLNGMEALVSGMYVEDASSPTGYTRTPDYDPSDTNNPASRGLKQANEYAENLSRNGEVRGGASFTDLLLNGDIGGFLLKGWGTGLESAPMTLSAYNPYTMALNAISMAGNNFRDNTIANPDIPTWKRAAMAIGSAAIEQAVEKYADPVFKYVGGGFSKKVTQEVTEEATKTIGKRIFGVLKDAGGEGLEEVVTNFGNDALGQALDWLNGEADYGLVAQWRQLKEQNPDADLMDFAMQKAKENIDSFFGGALAGAYTSGGVQATIGGLQYALGKTVSEEQITSNPNTPLHPATVNIAQQFDYGYSLDNDEEKDKVSDRYRELGGQLGALVGDDAMQRIDRNPTEALANIDQFGLDEAGQQLISDYIDAKAAVDGITLRIQEENRANRPAYVVNGNNIDEVDGEGNVIQTHEFANEDEMKAGLWELQAKRDHQDLQADLNIVRLNPNYDYDALIGGFAEQVGLDVDYIETILSKDPLELYEQESALVAEVAELIHSTLYDDSTVHEEQSTQDGAKLADAMSIDINDISEENAAQAQQLMNDLNAAQQALNDAFAKNEDLKQEVARMEQEGMPHQGIIASLDTFRPAEVQAVIGFYNAQAKFEGFRNQLAQKIDEEAASSTKRHTLNGTINGRADLGNIYTITDGTNEYYLVSGHITTNPTTGQITGSDSGLIIGMDLDGSFVQIGDTNGYSLTPNVIPAAQFEEAERTRLQEAWSAAIDPSGAMEQEQGSEEAGGETAGPAQQSVEDGTPIANDGQGGQDATGNTLNSDGSIFTEKVNSIDEITDEDFDEPSRSVELPPLSDNVANAISTNGRPVVIKKNIFEKNAEAHPDLDAADSREILSDALYKTNLVGQTQPVSRPDYKVAIHTGNKNSVVVLDIHQGKKQIEIVGWRRINEKGLAKMQRQAEREGGQFLILSPYDGSAAALSALPQDSSSVDKGTENSGTNQGIDVKVDENGVKRYEEGTPVDDAIADIQADGLDVGEVADASIAEAQEVIDKINGKATKTRKDLLDRKEAQDVVDYYTRLKERTALATQQTEQTGQAESEENVNVEPEAPNNPGNVVPSPPKLTVEEQKQQRIQALKAELGELFDEDFTKADDVYELVSMWIGRKRNLAWDDVNGKRGLQKELGWTRKIGGDTKFIETLLANKGEGVGVDEFVHMVWESPENSVGEEKRWTTEEIKEALLDLLKSAQSKSDVVDYAVNTREQQARAAVIEQRQREEEVLESGEAEVVSFTEEEIAQIEANLPFVQFTDEDIPDAPIVQLEKAVEELRQQEGMPEIKLVDTDRMSDGEWYDITSGLYGGAFVSQEEIETVRNNALEMGVVYNEGTGEIVVFSGSQTAEDVNNKVKGIYEEITRSDSVQEEGRDNGRDSVVAGVSQETSAVEEGEGQPENQSPVQGVVDSETAGGEGSTSAESAVDPYLQPRDAEEERIVKDIATQLQGEIFAQQQEAGKAKQKYDQKRAQESDRATDMFSDDKAFEQPDQLFSFDEMGGTDRSQEGVNQRAKAEKDAWDAAKAKLEQLQSPEERNSRVRGALDNHRRQTTIETENPIEAINQTAEQFFDERSGKAERHQEQEEEANYGKENKIVSQDRYEELKKRMRQKLLGQLNEGFDPEILAIGTEMAMFHIEAGARTFVDFAEKMLADLGDAIRPYLKAIYNGAREMPGMEDLRKEMTSAESISLLDVQNIANRADSSVNEHTEKNNEPNNVVSSQSKESRDAFVAAVRNAMFGALQSGEKPFKSINDLRTLAQQSGMTIDKDGRDDILLQELTELALVGAARETITKKHNGGFTRAAYKDIVKLYKMQPAINQRSSNRIKMQQYSTPLPMSFVAQAFANNDGKVLEPTAGNGMLVFGINPQNVTVNELDPTRLENLQEQGFGEVTNQDATQPFESNEQYDAVIANPPFGSAEAKDNDGKMIPGLAEQIALNALSKMKDNGRAAIIIGENMKYADNGAISSQKAFFTYLYDHYNVKGVIDMDGSLYAPPGQVSCLTIATHAGKLTQRDVVSNLMRMALMDDQEMPDAQEAQERLAQMNGEQSSNLRDWCRDRLAQEDFQIYLDSHPLPIGEELEPITDREEMWAILDEMSLQDLEQSKIDGSATRE